MQWLSYYGHVKGVKKVHSAFDSFKKVLMLKIAFTMSLLFLVMLYSVSLISDIECLHIIMFTFV